MAAGKRGDEGPLRRIRLALHEQLMAQRPQRGLSPLNLGLTLVIVAAVVIAMLETEPTVSAGHEVFFARAETMFATVFAVEYLARFWTAADDERLGFGWRARWRWLKSPWAIVDLLAFAPALFAGIGPAYLLRLLRLARILRLAKLGRFSAAWNLLARAVASRRYELLLTALAALFVLLLSATLMYLVEGPVQPDKFGSIPRSLWWSVVTLTTIGYGDVYPLTTLGKVLTSVTAIIGIGLIATPAGIMAAALSDALQSQRDAARDS